MIVPALCVSYTSGMLRGSVWEKLARQKTAERSRSGSTAWARTPESSVRGHKHLSAGSAVPCSSKSAVAPPFQTLIPLTGIDSGYQ
jgi:hypothetical protein